MDFKLCSDDDWMISYWDYQSRFMTGSVRIWSPTGENAIFLLEKAVTVWCSRTDGNTDQKTQSNPARGAPSEFARHRQDLGIEHITASVRRPITEGQIEAFHKSTR